MCTVQANANEKMILLFSDIRETNMASYQVVLEHTSKTEQAHMQ